VQRDAVVCLECGWKGKMLRRHLSTRHGMTGEQYLKRWNLPTEHPLTAPNYSEQRSSLAKELGLGRGARPELRAAESEPEPPRPRRGRPRRPAPEPREGL
jgi:predicted transcriptional regulator